MAKTIETVPLSKVHADPHQPRKDFDAERLGELIKSIKKHGIMNPLMVEESGTGYMVIDGERRFRAATEAGMKEVPVMIVAPQGEVQRLIQQFHLQAQHQDWSPLEKANAVGVLAEHMGVDVTKMAETLSLPKRTIDDYVAFAQLIERKSYEKSEMPLGYAREILSLRNLTKRLWSSELQKEFTHEMEADFEKAVIGRFKQGQFTKKSDMTKLKDSIRKDPKSVTKFINDEKISIEKMFIDTDARGARDYRNLTYAARSVSVYAGQGIEHGALDLFAKDESAVNTLKNAAKHLDAFIKQLN